MLSLLRSKASRSRTIVVGVKSCKCSREMLYHFLNVLAEPGDSVLTVHVQIQDDAFDVNSFHIHEDLCKSKEVSLHIKVCSGSSSISEAAREVRISHASILFLGCSPSGPKNSVAAGCVKRLPHTCCLLVMDVKGSILLQMNGTPQHGFMSLLSNPCSSKCRFMHRVPAAFPTENLSTMLTPSESKLTNQSSLGSCARVETELSTTNSSGNGLSQPLEVQILNKIRCFIPCELDRMTNGFDPLMVIGVGGHGIIDRGSLQDGQPNAVKVLRKAHFPSQDLLQEVDVLTNIKRKNIVQIIGHCHNEDMDAIVYHVLEGSLRQKMKELNWNKRMGVAVGVARALEYLHHCCDPPIIYRVITLSNILLTHRCQPILSNFGAAMALSEGQQASVHIRPLHGVGTFGYMAPAYVMYGKMDEKTDVYSYGVVLLELITGKEAIQANKGTHESLVLWARSLLRSGTNDLLVDPALNGDYDKKEMEVMMLAADLCLMNSYSRRPTDSRILRLLEKPDYWLKMGDEYSETCFEDEGGVCTHDDIEDKKSIMWHDSFSLKNEIIN